MSIGATAFLRRLALAVPPLGRFGVRTYLHTVDEVHERLEWVVESLKRELPLPWQERQVRLDNGKDLIIDGRSAVGREIYYRGSYEPDLCRALERWLKPGMIFMDAGANIGEFSVRASPIVGPDGQVHAFEASPPTFAILQQNVGLNGLTNVRLNHVALSSTTGSIEFFLSAGVASGSSSLRPAHDFSGATVSVPATTIDDYCAARDLTHIDLIKMDIEGAELDAFKGATRLLASDAAPVIAFEYHGTVAARFGVSKAELLGFLKQFGYRIDRMGSSAGATQHAGENVPENLLAIPPARQHG